MALLNRNLKWKEADKIPLMDKSNNKILDTIPNDVDDDDEDVKEKPFKQNNISLWASDAIVLVVEHLQYYAVLLSLSEHWGWPFNWVNATSFTFIFNTDIWEFRKVETGAFNHSRMSYINSAQIGFNYASYLAAWAVVLCIIGGIFGGVYLRWMKQRPLYLLLYLARWKRIMFLVLQLLCIPFGLAAARVFHCRKDTQGNNVMDVQNELKCFDAAHISMMVLVIIVFLFLFFFYPMLLSRWIQEQVFSNDPVRHEGYLQLKEAEYEQGLDILWDIGQYHLFSSFRRAWILYNPIKFFFKLILIVGYAMSVQSAFWSSAGITILFFLAIVAMIVRRPFRVHCFNVMIICSHFILSANVLIGNFMVRPPWENPEKFQIVSFLRYPTILQILMAFNFAWIAMLILWVLYLIALNNGLIRGGRIWPRLSYDSSNMIGEDTKKYLKAALKARHTLEHALSAIPLFAPIHELSQQVKVINAYCREAEYIGDPTHDTLWDLLDELIEAHNALAPVSVFGMSGKNSVRETSEEFIKLMPSFRKRLKQREYDLILVPPVKRRILLKMYVMSTFINNKRKKKVSPDAEITTKLQEALALFEVRSLSDYDTGFGSMSPSEMSRSTTRPMSQAISSRVDSNMTSFLDDVDELVGSPSTKKRKSDSPASQKFFFGSRPTSAQSNNGLLTPLSPRSNKVYGIGSPTSGKRSPRSNKVSPLMTSENNISQPDTTPLSPISDRVSSVASSRPGSTPYSSSRIGSPAQPNFPEHSSTLSIPDQVKETEPEQITTHTNATVII